MDTECFRKLGIDPFKSITPAELDKIISAKRDELQRIQAKAQTVPERNKAKADLDALPEYRKGILDPGCRTKAQEEVLALVTRDLDRCLFHRLDGSAVFFEKDIDTILEPARRKNWTVGPEAVSHIKGASQADPNDFKNLAADNAFKVISAIGTDDIVAWINGAIDSLYVEGSPDKPDKVTESTSYPTFKSTVSKLVVRARTRQKNAHFKEAEKYSSLVTKLTPMFANEGVYKEFKTALLMHSVEDQLQSSTTYLDYKSIAALVNSSMAGKGVDMDAAMKELERFCLSRGKLADFSKVAREQFSCGFCGCMFVVDAETNFCPYCNKPIVVSCPKCGTRNSSSNLHCKKCGADFSFLSNLSSVEDGLREDLSRGNLESIKAVLPKFEGYEAFADKALLKEAAGFVEETEVLMKRLSALESSKKYFSALNLCESHLRRRRGPEEVRIRRDRYSDIVKDIDRRFAAVPKGSERMYIDLVEECSDHPGLLRYFQSNRPSPPPKAEASQSRDGNVLLSMGSPPPKDATYLIVRKEGSSPLSETDGDLVAETKDSELVDRGITFGVEYRYAVYTKRWGVVSDSAALSKSIVVFADVVDASASPSDEGIRLDYRVPRGCTRVLVFRGEGSDPSASGQFYADVGTRAFFVDKEATDGSVSYHYRLVAEYSKGRAIPHRTAGAVVSCTPRPPPEPVSDLSVSSSGGLFTASFTSNDEPELFISSPEVDLGMSTCAATALDRSAKRVQGVIKGHDGSMSFRLPEGTVGRVYAVHTIGGTAVIGNGVKVSTLPDVSDARHVMDGDVCSLTFRWPEGCQSVKLALRSDRYPEGDADGESEASLPKDKYVREGSFRFKVPYQRTYACVYCLYGSKGASQGVRMTLSSRKDLPVIRYSFSYSGFFSRSCLCRITVSGDVKELPAMVLRGSDRTMPTRTAEGQTLEEIKRQEVHGMVTIAVRSPMKKMKLFFADREDDSRYKLLHPVRSLRGLHVAIHEDLLRQYHLAVHHVAGADHLGHGLVEVGVVGIDDLGLVVARVLVGASSFVAEPDRPVDREDLLQHVSEAVHGVYRVVYGHGVLP